MRMGLEWWGDPRGDLTGDLYSLFCFLEWNVNDIICVDVWSADHRPDRPRLMDGKSLLPRP